MKIMLNLTKVFPNSVMTILYALECNVVKGLLVMIVASGWSCQSLHAQKFTIRLLNAKSGKPMRNQNITIRWVNNISSLQIATDNAGAGYVTVPEGVKEFVMLSGPKVGKEQNRIAYKNCNDRSSALISVADVIRLGVVPKNLCSSKNINAQPGEAIFWALPRSFWDFQ